MNSIQPGSFLTLHYRLRGPDGADVDQHLRRQAGHAVAGHRAAGAGDGARLLGLAEGARQTFELAAGEAFGERNPELLQRVKLSLLRELGDPDEHYARRRRGAVPHARRPGQPMPAWCASSGDDWLLFDFNHPLAGQPVSFEVQVIGVL